MKKIFTALFLGLSLIGFSQTSLYTNNFDNPGDFTLEGGGNNEWLINNVYTGGTMLVGPVIPTVPQQPASFSNPNQNYLHPTSPLALDGSLNPILNANFVLGGGAGIYRATMNNTVDASNYEDITVSFWRTGGLNGVKLIYSIDGGTTWLDAGLDFQGSPSTWEEETITINALDGEPDIRVGFEMNEATLADPAPSHYHSIDELSITGTPSSGGGNNAAIDLTFILPNVAFCEGQEISADFLVTNGTINAGNEYTFELSDASGSFANPTVIGNLSSTQSSGTISGNLPTGTTGHNFRVRVNASDEAITGNNNGTDFIIASLPDTPVITQNANMDLEVTTNASSFEWLLNGDVIQNSQNESTITPIVNGNYRVVASNDTCEVFSDVFVVDNLVNIAEQTTIKTNLYPNPVKDQLNLVYDNALVREIFVTDVTGKVIFSSTKNISQIDFSMENKGLYFVHVVGEDVEIFKIVKH